MAIKLIPPEIKIIQFLINYFISDYTYWDTLFPVKVSDNYLTLDLEKKIDLSYLTQHLKRPPLPEQFLAKSPVAALLQSSEHFEASYPSMA